MRQAVISIYQNDGSNSFAPIPTQDIIFRQPYHNFGLAMSFSFQKSFMCPYSNCNISIQNPSQSMIDSLLFDTENNTAKPKIEIRAGESEYRLLSLNDVNLLKNTLPLIYTGYPIFFTTPKTPGTLFLNITLSDMNPPDVLNRINASFAAGTTLAIVLQKLLTGIDNDVTDILPLLNIKLEHDLIYPLRNLHSQVLPELSRLYGFLYNRTADNVLKFVPSGIPDKQLPQRIIDNISGMIEYPTQINWTHWSVRTFFGRPAIFYPWNWVEVSSTSSFGTKQCMITEAKYSFNDSSAEINYTVSPNGNPVSTNPIKPA